MKPKDFNSWWRGQGNAIAGCPPKTIAGAAWSAAEAAQASQERQEPVAWATVMLGMRDVVFDASAAAKRKAEGALVIPLVAQTAAPPQAPQLTNAEIDWMQQYHGVSVAQAPQEGWKDELLALWPEIRQLQEGWRGDASWSEWG